MLLQVDRVPDLPRGETRQDRYGFIEWRMLPAPGWDQYWDRIYVPEELKSLPQVAPGAPVRDRLESDDGALAIDLGQILFLRAFWNLGHAVHQNLEHCAVSIFPGVCARFAKPLPKVIANQRVRAIAIDGAKTQWVQDMEVPQSLDNWGVIALTRECLR